MAKKDSTERFLDFGVRGKFGKAWELGQIIFGQGHFGEKEIEWDKNEFGFATFGITKFGSDDKRWGIYQRRKEQGKIFFIKENFYTPKNPRTETQQNWRNNFIAGMAAWALLTDEQKKWYRERANKLGLPAQNLFLKSYLKS